jgi:N-acetylglucosaminyldiphosphoundecaprenol N-acetyl-beta-D-mannosaminyltransferase
MSITANSLNKKSEKKLLPLNLASWRPLRNSSLVSILDVEITNISQRDAIERMEQLIQQQPLTTHSIFFVNAHTLNLASENPKYRDVLNSASDVFGDGTGVRWAARLGGVIMRSNLAGTDLIPEFLLATGNRGYRYFLLGADAASVTRAAQVASDKFPGWELSGFHHGYFTKAETASVIEKINSAQPHLLLVGMGNPKQECWIHSHQQMLRVPLCMGVGALFDRWAGNLKRAPPVGQTQGCEWLHILLQQPYKWQRYLIGNPKFLIRIVRDLN